MLENGRAMSWQFSWSLIFQAICQCFECQLLKAEAKTHHWGSQALSTDGPLLSNQPSFATAMATAKGESNRAWFRVQWSHGWLDSIERHLCIAEKYQTIYNNIAYSSKLKGNFALLIHGQWVARAFPSYHGIVFRPPSAWHSATGCARFDDVKLRTAAGTIKLGINPFMFPVGRCPKRWK